MLDVFLRITQLLRSMVSWPFRVLFLALGIANFKIVYKSGHVEYLFLKSFNGSISDGGLSSVKWESLGSKTPICLGINDIAAVYQLY